VETKNVHLKPRPHWRLSVVPENGGYSRRSGRQFVTVSGDYIVAYKFFQGHWFWYESKARVCDFLL